MSLNDTLVRAQLYALRMLLDGVTETVDRIIEAMDDAPPPPRLAPAGCAHPPEQQLDATTLGGTPQVYCLLCGQQRAGTVETNQG